MKCFGHLRRSYVFVVASLAYLVGSAQLVMAIETEIASADLATLLQSSGALRSPGGDVRFSNFVMVQAPTGSAVPNLAEILLTANGASLLWEIDEDRRILRAGDNYELGIKFQATALIPQQVLASARLDIAGATIGTKGDANAQLVMELLDNEGAPLGSLSVVEASAGRHLIDTEDIRGSNQWMARLQIRASGGTGTAALVLTDLETSFATEAIPEPCSLTLGGISAGLLSIVAWTYRPIRCSVSTQLA
jgi:hypothetical protein